MSRVERNAQNPIITIDNLKPSADGLEIIGVFNPAACRFGDETVLVMRVAEACPPEDGWIKIPVMDVTEEPKLEIRSWKIDDLPDLDLSDPRKYTIGGKIVLTSISHLRIARSADGVNFTIEQNPDLHGLTRDEIYGIEDPRITRIGDTYYMAYTAVSDDGYGVSLMSTADFTHFTRLGMIFPPQNKDACLFPEKVNSRYIALHRPTIDSWGKPSIWYSDSADLIRWGSHSCILRPRDNRWEYEKIGAGPQPVKTPEGWLLLYHGCGYDSVYSLHLCLLDLNDPHRILKQGDRPVLAPEQECEKQGFFPNVVFSNGWVEQPDGTVRIYYGAADRSICVAETTVDDLLGSL